VFGTVVSSSSHLAVHRRRCQELLQISPVVFTDSSQRSASSFWRRSGDPDSAAVFLQSKCSPNKVRRPHSLAFQMQRLLPAMRIPVTVAFKDIVYDTQGSVRDQPLLYADFGGLFVPLHSRLKHVLAR
jgi:hypothetical protein